MKYAGIDPGTKGKLPVYNVAVIGGTDIISREALSLDDALTFCAGCTSAVIEMPKTDSGSWQNPHASPAMVRATTAAIMRTLKAALKMAAALRNIGIDVREFSADDIRLATVGKIPRSEKHPLTRKMVSVNADARIKDWLMATHLILERRLSAEVRRGLLANKGALSTDHKRDAYLAALCAERLAVSRALAATMEGK